MTNVDQYLVGGKPPPLKNVRSSIGMTIPNRWKKKTCSKPSTGDVFIWLPQKLTIIHGNSWALVGHCFTKNS